MIAELALALAANRPKWKFHPNGGGLMRPFCLPVVLAAGIAMLASIGSAQLAPTAGPYKVLRTVKVGGEGGFDYIFADVKGRRLYTPRSGPKGNLAVFNLDTLEQLGEIDNV